MNRVYLFKKTKGRLVENSFRSVQFIVFTKIGKGVKIGRANYNNIPEFGLGGGVGGVNEMAIEVHCDACDILPKGGSVARIGIFGVGREKIDWRGGIKITITSDGSQ